MVLWIQFPESLKHAPMSNVLEPAAFKSFVIPVSSSLRLCAWLWCRKKMQVSIALYLPLAFSQRSRLSNQKARDSELQYFREFNCRFIQAGINECQVRFTLYLKWVGSLGTGVLLVKMYMLSLSTSITRFNTWKEELPGGHRPVDELPGRRTQLLN